MKKITLLLIAICLITITYSQSNIVNDFFNNYGGTEGFTTINLTGELFKMMSQIEQEDEDFQQFVNSVYEVKILAQDENICADNKMNFYDEIYNKLDKNIFKELMTLVESNKKVNMLINEKDGKIREFLLIVGGDENVLIQIKGDIDLKNINKVARNINIEGFEQLQYLDQI